PLRPVIGGIVIVVAVVVFDLRDYQGLSIQLALDAQSGSAAGQWITKLGLTAVSIGSGFVGGEVIPLVVVGALAGASFGRISGGSVAMFAVIGSVAVLAGAANTPVACTILGVELFGGAGLAFIAVACAASYATSGHAGIYHSQHVSVHKSGRISAR
ncbi:MAG: chloride channel protein, partial [Actinomycetota bacterium]